MKVNLLFVVLITSVFYTPIFAQQKVRDNTIRGTVLPNKDALLELESNNKGLLHARVQLRHADDAAPLSQHRAGMMVYNTATVNDVVPGIYYNNGSRWVLVAAMDDIKPINYDSVTYELTFVDGNDETQVINLEEVVKATETLTAIVGEVTHLGEDGDGPAVYRITYTDEGDEKTEIDIAATNGLHIDGTSGAIKLGGALVYEETEIITTATNTLAITGLQEGDETEDRIVVVDRDGVLKTIPAIIPSAIVKKDANYTAVATDETIL